MSKALATNSPSTTLQPSSPRRLTQVQFQGLALVPQEIEWLPISTTLTPGQHMNCIRYKSLKR